MNGNYVENVLGSTYNANNKEHVENVLTCAWVRLLWAKEGIDARLRVPTHDSVMNKNDWRESTR